MKGKEEASERMLKEIEANEISDIEFKAMVIRKLNELTEIIFSHHKKLNLETNIKEKTPKHSKLWRLSSMPLNNECVKNEIREEIKKILEISENEHTTIQNV